MPFTSDSPFEPIDLSALVISPFTTNASYVTVNPPQEALALLTENGEYIITESGEYLTTEA